MTRPATLADEASAARQAARVLSRSAHVARDDDPRRQVAVQSAARYAVRRAQETTAAARRARRQEASEQAARDALTPQPGAVWHEHDPAGPCPSLCAGHTFRRDGTCPARSPESGTPCVLLDQAETHPAGHQSATLPGTVTTVCWATTDDDRTRWEDRP